jgi:imidazolonepropionase-like amidohydrolase
MRFDLMRRATQWILLAILSMGVQATAIARGPVVQALVGATLIDGTGRPPIEDASLVIADGRITAIGRRPDVKVPSGAHVVDLHGKYLMPGMLDANVHLFFGVTIDALIRYDDRYEDVIAEAAQVALKNGVTTVFDTWGPRQELTRVRGQIAAGQRQGSRIFLGGNIIGLTGPTSTDFYNYRTLLGKAEADRIDARWEQGAGPELLWLTPDNVRERIRAYIRSGHVDFLKYASSGHAQEQFIAFSEAAQKAIVDEGHRAGLTVQAHSTSPESLRLEIEAGADLLQHCDATGLAEMPEPTLTLIAEHKIPCAALFETQKHLAWVLAQDGEQSDGYRSAHIKHENDRRLVAAGAMLLMTTDAGVLPADIKEVPKFSAAVSGDDLPIEMGQGHFRWLEAASELGMKPMDALEAATINTARAYHQSAEVGSLEVGKRADVLVLSADPLADPDNYRRIERVMKDGQFVDIQSLPNPRVLTKP